MTNSKFTKKLQNILIKNLYGFVSLFIFIFLLSSFLSFSIFFVKAQNGIITVPPGTLVLANLSCRSFCSR